MKSHQRQLVSGHGKREWIFWSQAKFLSTLELTITWLNDYIIDNFGRHANTHIFTHVITHTIIYMQCISAHAMPPHTLTLHGHEERASLFDWCVYIHRQSTPTQKPVSMVTVPAHGRQCSTWIQPWNRQGLYKAKANDSRNKFVSIFWLCFSSLENGGLTSQRPAKRASPLKP